MAVPRSPEERGLPQEVDFRTPLPQSLFGEQWTLEGWHKDPNVVSVLQNGHRIGWIESSLPGLKTGRWVAVYQNCFMADATTRGILVHETAATAALTVRQAYLQNV